MKWGVRRGDLEPYRALSWVGWLFKAAAIFLAVALLTEVVVGLRFEGWAATPTLLGELARTIVFAVLLWGGGDLVRLLIHVGHDVRAQRILQRRMLGVAGGSGPAARVDEESAQAWSLAHRSGDRRRSAVSEAGREAA